MILWIDVFCNMVGSPESDIVLIQYHQTVINCEQQVTFSIMSMCVRLCLLPCGDTFTVGSTHPKIKLKEHFLQLDVA